MRVEKIMPAMTDPMAALRSLQQVVKSGDSTVTLHSISDDYVVIYDQPNGQHRYSYAKIIKREVQTLSIFALTQPIEGVPCFNVGYAVKKNRRRNGLAVEAVEKGISELRIGLGRNNVKSFYVEAVIDMTNIPSIKVAEKLFSSPGEAIKDHFTGTPALHFKKLVKIS